MWRNLTIGCFKATGFQALGIESNQGACRIRRGEYSTENKADGVAFSANNDNHRR